MNNVHLSDLEISRYARSLLLPGFGVAEQRSLKAAAVLIVGAGGLGAPVIAYLAAAGVGTLRVVDDDVVALSNLQRQFVHALSDVERGKAESASEFALAINPEVQLEPLSWRLDADNVEQLLQGVDVVVDGSDNFPTRYIVCDAAEQADIPVVSGSVLGYDGQVTVYWPPRGPSMRDLFPEHITAAANEESCASRGVLGPLCGVVGSSLAVETLKLITGVGTVRFAELQMYDALEARWRYIPTDALGESRRS